MAPQKETMMVLKVDLGCHRCYTKVKRLLCCYPQITDQIYSEKQNTVTIKVVCCSPEKIMDKLLSRGGKSIKGIHILEPPKKPAPDQPKQAPAPPAEKPPPKEAPADKPPKAAAPPPADAPEKLKKSGSKSGSKNGGGGGAADAAKPPGDAKPPKDAKPPGGDAKPPGDAAKPPGGDAKPKDAAPAPKPADQAAAMMQMMAPERVQYYPGYPVNAGCLECYDGRMCYHVNGYGGFGAPPLPPPPAGGWGYYGPPPPTGGYGYGYKPVNQYGDYVSDENATGCVVM